ncbi:hypothetical protein [Nocardia huaxiensis]|uniref:Uncharacterized protein n=1 Tax=Nocardia huaxiensis TaxID=2755382 RepID=A0A7D6V739_9NOCA|nr:hypothetical protein [Nocardia huaxiensis]QLY28314.1 hypothetical protein H0264_23365 [Nocardia huaxiensis]UFS98245.1 hypothetical protein LPY97_10280 [Nocardia huaxiensis]
MPTSLAPHTLPLKALIAGRILVATSFLFTPRVVARAFGMKSEGTPAIAMGRMFAIRNAALAAGLANPRWFTAPKAFLGVNILMDAVDAAAFLAAGRRGEFGPRTTVLTTTVAVSAVLAGVGALAADQ